MRGRRTKNITENIDWLLISIYAVMVLLGWLNIYAANYTDEAGTIFDFSQNYGKQLMWIGTSAVLAIAVMLLDVRFYETFAYVFYGIFVALLVAVLLVGTEIKGSQSWIVIGGVSIQPAEFAKYGTALALAKYLSSISVKMDQFKTKFASAVILLVPAALILLQPDAGSTLVYASFIFVLYREGLSGKVLIVGVAAAVLFILTLFVEREMWNIEKLDLTISGEYILMGSLLVLAGLILLLFRKNISSLWRPLTMLAVVAVGYVASVNYIFNEIFEDRHRNRIYELLGIISDPSGTGYNQHQSKIAIGSGGFWGKGYLEGTQTKFNFVPEQSTDFIFCTVGEEWGFVGTSIIIVLFLGLFIRIIWIAERQRSTFARVYAYSVVCIFFFHFAINIGMTIGLAPVIGIPLPFFSYGGSSLWSFTILLFTLIKLDAERINVLR